MQLDLKFCECFIPCITLSRTSSEINAFLCLFGVLHRFQHYTFHITMGS